LFFSVFSFFSFCPCFAGPIACGLPACGCGLPGPIAGLPGLRPACGPPACLPGPIACGCPIAGPAAACGP
jgi:hypothetical protein